MQVDRRGRDGLATGRHIVLSRCNERHLRRVLARRRVLQVLDQTHAQGAVGADLLEALQRSLVLVDRRLQLDTGVAEVGGVEEDGRDAGGDHGHLEAAHAGHVQCIDQIAGREHRARITVIGRIDEFQLDLGRREGHAIQLEIAGLLHFAIAHRHVGDDGLADVGLPDAYGAQAIARHPGRIDQPMGDRERTHRGAEVAAIAAPVDEGGIDRDLAVQVVHIVVRHRSGGDDHAFAGAGRCTAHAIGLLAIRIGRADHAHQQRIACGARHLRGLGQVLQAEEHALAGATAHVGGGNTELREEGHGSVSWMRRTNIGVELLVFEQCFHAPRSIPDAHDGNVRR